MLRIHHQFLIALMAAFWACIYAANSSALTTISTLPAWDSVTGIGTFGFPNTATYGQTFTVPTTDNLLTQFTLYTNMPGIATYRGAVFAWDSNALHVAGTALYLSEARCGHGGWTAETFIPSTSLTLSAGQKYVLAITASYDGTTNSSCLNGSNATLTGSIGFTNTDAYTGGAFYALNNGPDLTQFTTVSWLPFSGGSDLAFSAQFTSAPGGGGGGGGSPPGDPNALPTLSQAILFLLALILGWLGVRQIRYRL